MKNINETMIEEVTVEEIAGDAAVESKVKYVGAGLAGLGLIGLIVLIVKKLRNKKTDKTEKPEKKTGIISKLKKVTTKKKVESEVDSEENAND